MKVFIFLSLIFNLALSAGFDLGDSSKTYQYNCCKYVFNLCLSNLIHYLLF